MKRIVTICIFVASCTPPPETPGETISAPHIAAHTRLLAHDLLEGRGVGGRGEGLAVEYIAAQFALAGAAPAAGDGTYFQRVPLVGVETLPESSIRIAGRELSPGGDYVGLNERQTEQESLRAEVVFVGRGIVAPEFDWDDYKQVDVTGKFLLLFTNEPPSEDDGFFGGRALTYYGRWTFKFEEAGRRGAAGVLIVHTDETAGYPWEVVRNSWGQRKPFVKLEPGRHALAPAGWLHSKAAASVFAASQATRGKSIDELVAMANEKDFRPIPLGVEASVDLRSAIAPMDTRNVLAKFVGSDPALREEAVLYTAHWDHLGLSEAAQGDSIYNGAVDNATGCGVLLEIARAYGSLAAPPARTILFAAVGAEESGLLGSEYYGAHPAIAAGKTAVNLNYDGLYPFGPTSDIKLPGYERTTLKATVEELAAKFGQTLTPEAHPEQGYYYRSDHFSLAKRGVPAFSIGVGGAFLDKPEGWGEEAVNEYRTRHYHQPSDEFREDWDFRGIADLARFGFELGRIVAEQADLPSWRKGDEFLAAREQSWR